MIRSLIAVLIFVGTVGPVRGNDQQATKFKNFNSYTQLVPGIDFFASNRKLVEPYKEPATEAMNKLRSLLGTEIPRGAVFICSTLAQKDSIYEPKVLRMGYGWTLSANTPDVRMQEMMERIKSQMGDDIPAEILTRIKNMPPERLAEAEKEMVKTTVKQIAYAVLQTSLAENLRYRSSRLDDMGKSPLPDWLDIAIASYASGSDLNVAFLQENMDQSFPLEDIVSMSRPFVASFLDQYTGSSGGGGGFMGRSGSNGGGGFMGQSGSNGGGGFMGQSGSNGGRTMGFPGGGQGFPSFGAGGRGPGGFGGDANQRGRRQRTLSKDEQDRMLFDTQSATFFSFMLQKFGLEKMKELVKEAREGKESREFITRRDILGPDFEKIESEWVDWIKTQKPERTFEPPSF